MMNWTQFCVTLCGIIALSVQLSISDDTAKQVPDGQLANQPKHHQKRLATFALVAGLGALIPHLVSQSRKPKNTDYEYPLNEHQRDEHLCPIDTEPIWREGSDFPCTPCEGDKWNPFGGRYKCQKIGWWQSHYAKIGNLVRTGVWDYHQHGSDGLAGAYPTHRWYTERNWQNCSFAFHERDLKKPHPFTDGCLCQLQTFIPEMASFIGLEFGFAGDFCKMERFCMAQHQWSDKEGKCVRCPDDYIKIMAGPHQCTHFPSFRHYFHDFMETPVLKRVSLQYDPRPWPGPAPRSHHGRNADDLQH